MDVLVVDAPLMPAGARCRTRVTAALQELGADAGGRAGMAAAVRELLWAAWR